MASHDLTLEILTPRGPLREGVAVPGVEVPGLLGEIGVLPEHEPFITAIRPGVVRFKDGATSVRVAVGTGFLEVRAGGRVVLLVDRACAGDEVDVDATRDELSRLVAETAGDHGALSAPARRARDLRQGWLEAQLRAAGASPAHH